MITAILIIILLVMSVAIFYAGVRVGVNAMGKRLIDIADAILNAIAESPIPTEQKLELIEKLKAAAEPLKEAGKALNDK